MHDALVDQEVVKGHSQSLQLLGGLVVGLKLREPNNLLQHWALILLPGKGILPGPLGILDQQAHFGVRRARGVGQLDTSRALLSGVIFGRPGPLDPNLNAHWGLLKQAACPSLRLLLLLASIDTLLYGRNSLLELDQLKPRRGPKHLRLQRLLPVLPLLVIRRLPLLLLPVRPCPLGHLLLRWGRLDGLDLGAGSPLHFWGLGSHSPRTAL
mmetsp:Transcript_45685/g.99151  ORF Transcript_45685/g.99151 Transcript_45685/m.99151 type:complete len:211 (+) Transcript_45685:920-1552(+)